MRLIAFILALTCLFSIAVFAEPPRFSTPEPKEMADDLRKPGPLDKDYPLPQDAAKSKKIADANLA